MEVKIKPENMIGRLAKVKDSAFLSGFVGRQGRIVGYENYVADVEFTGGEKRGFHTDHLDIDIHPIDYLEPGCIVVLRNGKKAIYVEFGKDKSFVGKDDIYKFTHNVDLIAYGSDEYVCFPEESEPYDIMQIWYPNDGYAYKQCTPFHAELVWFRQEWPMFVCGINHTEGSNPNKTYLFESPQFLHNEENVVVQTSRGKQLGRVKWCKQVNSLEDLNELMKNYSVKATLPLAKVIEKRVKLEAKKNG